MTESHIGHVLRIACVWLALSGLERLHQGMQRSETPREAADIATLLARRQGAGFLR